MRRTTGILYEDVEDLELGEDDQRAVDLLMEWRSDTRSQT